MWDPKLCVVRNQIQISLTRLLYHDADALTGKLNWKIFADFILCAHLGFVCQIRLLRCIIPSGLNLHFP